MGDDFTQIYEALGVTEEQLKKADEEMGGILEIFHGIDGDGDMAYVYVAVKPSLYMEYRQKIEEQAEIDLDYYGKCLYSGKGSYPDVSAQKEVEKKYGVDHSFIGKFQEELEEIASNY